MHGRSLGTPLVVAALVAALVLGVGLGAVAVAMFDDRSTTVLRQVTVTASEPAADVDKERAADPAGGGPDRGEPTLGAIYESASKGVVEITARSDRSRAQGSGFVIDETGHIVTNEHVVRGATSISVSFPNGSSFSGELVGTDPSTDLAVIRVSAPQSLLEPLRFSDSDALEVGDSVLALGSPFGLEGTLTSGIVSALHRQITAPNNFTITDTIQTDAAVNHGNSGGPLLDRRGLVIGVNAQIESESGGSDGVGFAIPSNTVRSIASQLIETGEVRHAYLGIVMVGVPGGVAITQVRSGTPAEKAGLRASTGTKLVDGQQRPSGGDVIVAFAGKKVESSAALQSAVDSFRPGDTVKITVLRDGKRVNVDVTLAVRP